MKKTILLVAIATIFGMQSAHLMADENSFGEENVPPISIKDMREAEENRQLEKEYEERKKQERKQALVSLVKEQLKITKEQLEGYKQIHQSIIGSRKFDIPQAKNVETIYFYNPHSIYNKSRFDKKNSSINPNISKMEESVMNQILEQNLDFFSVPEIRALIENRSQYAAIVDKAVSLQVFDEVESRFKYIKKALITAEQMNDIKGMSELNTYVEGTAAVIQNETTKLQMVAHLRDAEQKLIDQQKYKRNVKILSHNNKQMPTIKVRYIQAAGIQ